MSKPTPADIENLIELFNRSDWEEMHLKTDGLEIFVSNDPKARTPQSAAGQSSSDAAGAAAAASTQPTAPATPTASSVAPAEVAIPDGMVAVRAPNLGTFYRAPKPGAPPYVEVGQHVSADSEVCLIEVMKLFTPVKAGVEGVVRHIFIEDAQMVEFEQVLVIIEPA